MGAEPQPSEIKEVNEAIASRDPATIQQMCDSLQRRKAGADTADKGAWEKLRKKCLSALPGGTLSVTPGPSGGGKAGGGGTTGGGTGTGGTGTGGTGIGGTGTGGTGTGGTSGGTTPVTPTPAPGPVLPPAPPKPPKLPDHFCTLQERIDYTNELGYLKNRWWGYANKLRELSRAKGFAPEYNSPIHDADAQAHALLELQLAAAQIPIIDCSQHSSTGGGYVPPSGLPGGALGGSGITGYVGIEVGGGGAKASYDELVIEPRSFVAGAFAGVRIQQPGNWFIGLQGGFFGTDLTKDAARDFNVGLRWGAPFDVQVGTMMVVAGTPVALYAYAGPMVGGTRTVYAGATDTFLLFGGTLGVGADVAVGPNWSVGANIRYYNLGPSDVKSEGQHVDGVNATVNLKFRF